MPYAIVTGGTQGIGKAIAEKLLSEGISVAICARSLTDLHQVESEWKSRFPNVDIIAHRADLSVKQDVSYFAHQVLSRFPSVDILVNNAGLFFPGQLMTEADGHMEKLMNVNFFSAYHLTREVVPVMKQKQSGHIFNICSVAGLKAYDNGGAYSVTKYALMGFSDNLRQELMNDGIKVTAISPGAVYSRSWENAGIEPSRMMETKDIAEIVWNAYNLSPAANVEHVVIRPLKGDL